MLSTVERGVSTGLNDSGEMLVTRIVHGAALHVGRGERTSEHAHYAWKVHVGLDAPVWLKSERFEVTPAERARVVVVPPGLPHCMGAVGWSHTVLVAPGTRGTPFRGAVPSVIDGKRGRYLLDVCRALPLNDRQQVSDFVSQVVRRGVEPTGAVRVDARVRKALSRLATQPGCPLATLALDLSLSVDRLSHLTVVDTGMPLRRHALWSRLLALLSANKQYSSIAAAALDAGFSDHAHMTRAYRALLGRLPSEFSGPPDAIEPWSAWR